MCFRAFIREITNHLSAGAKSVQKRITPSGREKRRGVLVDELVRLGEKAGILLAWRGREFLYGDDEADITTILVLLHRIGMKQRELFGNVLLGEFPIAHISLRREYFDARQQEPYSGANVRPREDPKSRQ